MSYMSFRADPAGIILQYAGADNETWSPEEARARADELCKLADEVEATQNDRLGRIMQRAAREALGLSQVGMDIVGPGRTGWAKVGRQLIAMGLIKEWDLDELLAKLDQGDEHPCKEPGCDGHCDHP